MNCSRRQNISVIVGLFAVLVSCVLVTAGPDLVAESVGDEHAIHSSRSLLGLPTEAPKVIPGYYIDGKCLFLFQNGMEGLVKIYKEEKTKDTTDIVFVQQYIFLLKAEPTSRVTSECNNANQTYITLSYSGDQIRNNTNITSVKVNMIFETNNKLKRWALSPASSVHLDGNGDHFKKNLKLKESGVTASTGFSFSCLNLELQSPDPNNETLASISLSVKRFQFQPFTTNNTNRIFADSFDCSTWFTISLWVGLFTLLLFTAIVASGIYMLFEIKTMDRFENPKGKTITVSAAE